MYLKEYHWCPCPLLHGKSSRQLTFAMCFGSHQRILELSPIITAPDKHLGFLIANKFLGKSCVSSATLEKCFCGLCSKNTLNVICDPLLWPLFLVETAGVIFSLWWSLCISFCINLLLGILFQLQTLTHTHRNTSYCSMRQWTVNKLTVINQNDFTNLFLAFVDSTFSELRMKNASSVNPGLKIWIG